MKLNKDLCVMAIAGVITLGNVAEGSIEQFKAEQEAAKKTKKPLLVLPNAPESAEEQSSDAGTIGEGMSPDEVSEKSEASTEQTEGLCLLRVVKNDSSEASCEPIDEYTQYPLGHCYIFGAKTKSQDLGCETQEEPYYSEDPVKRKLWEKQLKKAGFPILETEDVVLPDDGEDLLKFKKRLAGMELNAETKRRSFEKVCDKCAEANEILWCSLLDDEISQEEIKGYLDENLSAEQKAKMCKNSSKFSNESQAESYKKLVYALLKFGLSADEILAVNYSYLPLFNYLNEAGENTEEFYQCYYTDNDGESDFNGKGIPKEEKLLLIHCLIAQVPIHFIRLEFKLSIEQLNLLRQGLEISRVLRDLEINCGLNDEGAKVLGSVLKHNRILESLDLGASFISNKGAIAISEGLRANSTLLGLGFKESNIGSVGIVAITKALRDNPSITELSLCKTHLTAPGVFAIKDMLENNSSLTSFEWSDSGVMSSTQLGCITEGLKNNSSLTTLFLGELNSESVALIADTMESNTTITELWCSGVKK